MVAGTLQWTAGRAFFAAPARCGDFLTPPPKPMKTPLILIATASLPLLFTSCYTDGYPYGGGGYGGGYDGGRVYHRGHYYDGRSHHRRGHYDHRRDYGSGHYSARPYTSRRDSHRPDHQTTRRYSDTVSRENPRSRVSIGGW